MKIQDAKLGGFPDHTRVVQIDGEKLLPNMDNYFSDVWDLDCARF